MRKPIIAGNWKMNMTPDEAKELVSALIPLVKDAQCDVVVCPPYVDLCCVAKLIEGTNIQLGAQNVHWAEKGAFTGEISAKMLLARGVKYTGATVHYVNHIPDGGEILLQQPVPVLPGDTPEVLQRRVMEQAEWILLPQAAELVSAKIQNDKEKRT